MQILVKGIRLDVYPRKGSIHAFQTPFTIQEHGDERNSRDELLSSGPWKFFKSKIYE
jgi:hypothetical protein